MNERLRDINRNYDSDSSTEETENITGDVPLEWYKDLPHIDYNMDGNKILKPATVVELDQFLVTVEGPDGWKTVRSKQEDKCIGLNDTKLDIIQRL